MKYIALALYIFVGNIVFPPLFYKEGVRGSLAYADDLAMAATVEDSTHTIMGGVIKTVSWADPTKGTKSEMVVVNTEGKKINIYVASTTTLWDKDSKPIMQDKLVPKSHINIIYLTSPEGINIGKSIKILK